MILFKQTYVQDGQICGHIKLDDQDIGEFRQEVLPFEDAD